MWSDGRGVSASRPSPFVPRVFHRMRIAPMARREAKRFIHPGVSCVMPSLPTVWVVE
jgi:hypothetical protein